MDTNGNIASFLAEFSTFENHSLRLALRSLSKNDGFALTAERLLDVNARLKLVKRMAFVRNVDPVVCEEIERIEGCTRQLAAKRDELVHASHSPAESDVLPLPSHEAVLGLSRREREALKTVWTPTVAEIDQCRTDVSEIQSSLTAIVDRLERGPSPT